MSNTISIILKFVKRFIHVFRPAPGKNVSINGTVDPSSSSSPLKPDAPQPTVDASTQTTNSVDGDDSKRVFVRLIESPQIPLYELLNKCNYCEQRDASVTTTTASSCKMDRYSVCGYRDFVTYVYKTSCVEQPTMTEQHSNTMHHNGDGVGYILINSQDNSFESTRLEKTEDIVTIADDNEVVAKNTEPKQSEFTIDFNIEIDNDDVIADKQDRNGGQLDIDLNTDVKEQPVESNEVESMAEEQGVEVAPPEPTATSCDVNDVTMATNTLDLSQAAVDNDLDVVRHASTSADIEQVRAPVLCLIIAHNE